MCGFTHYVLLVIPAGSRIQAPLRATSQASRSKHLHFPHHQFFLNISNIWKNARHVSCLNFEGKTIKPTNLDLVANTRYRRLLTTLGFGLQTPRGILESGEGRGSNNQNGKELVPFTQLVKVREAVIYVLAEFVR